MLRLYEVADSRLVGRDPIGRWRSLQDDRKNGHSGAERSGAVESEGGDPIGR